MATKSKSISLLLIAIFVLVTPAARGQTLEVLHSFNGTNGAYPRGELVQGTNGDLYGTTSRGGIRNVGTIFKITTNGALTSLFSFVGNSDGDHPLAGLCEGSDGLFYGTTYTSFLNVNEIPFGDGTVFKITPEGTLTTLINFKSFNGGSPTCTPVLGNDGYIYGTTSFGRLGSTNMGGSVFKIAPGGQLTTLAWFNSISATQPFAGVTQGNDGNFYGTTEFGGNGFGTVYQMTPDGVLTLLIAFDGTNGRRPRAGLVEGVGGVFYGATLYGGANNLGTIFQITASGDLTTLANFNGTNGSNPNASLLRGPDGNFYGSCSYGGCNDHGTVFQITPEGNLTTLICLNNTNGSNPFSKLMRAKDGNLYGTTFQGGAYDLGTIFRIVFPYLNSRVSGNELVLSWPTNSLGFTLQSSSNLSSPTNWTDLTNSPVVNGDQFVVTNSISASLQFFRLKK